MNTNPRKSAADGTDVYFIGVRHETWGMDKIKIGRTFNVERRMREIEKPYRNWITHTVTGPYSVELLAVIKGTGGWQERELHRTFSHLRTVGEWFRPAPDLMQYIENLGRH